MHHQDLGLPLLSLNLCLALISSDALSQAVPTSEQLPPTKHIGRTTARDSSDYRRVSSAAQRTLRVIADRPAPTFAVTADFDWEMEPRFGLDVNQNRIPDLPNTAEYTLGLLPDACATTNCNAVIPLFNVTFTARAGLTAPSPGQTFFKWRIDGVGTTFQAEANSASSRWTTKLPEGKYHVTLTVYRATGGRGNQPVGVLAQKSVASTIVVEDILIASIGDSFSSGEGNPERVRGQIVGQGAAWADDGSMNANSVVNQRHRRAHRSTLAWPAQVALAVEQADPHTSVTFVSVATTGATISHLLTQGVGAEHEPLPSGGMLGQLTELKSIIGNRRIDLLTISIGINDIGFAKVIAAYLLGNEPSVFADNAGARQNFARAAPHEQRTAIVNAANSGAWNAVLDGGCTDCIGINNLPSQYGSLASDLEARFPGQILNVTVVSYPDATGERSGNSTVWCQKIVDDMINTSTGVLLNFATGIPGNIVGLVTPDTEIGGKEQQSMVEEILNPLNRTVEIEATRSGWNAVSVQHQFADGHGYCAAWPNMRPGTAYYFALGNPFPGSVPPSDQITSWFRTARQSNVVQGPLATCAGGNQPFFCIEAAIKTLGTIHPNELGHQAVKSVVLRGIVLPVDIPGLGLHDTDDQLGEARTTPPPPQDFLFERSDVDVFRVDTSTLSDRPRNAVAAGSPKLGITVSVSSSSISRLNPRIRLYDTQGTMISEIVGQHRPLTTLTHSLAGGDDQFIVAISADTNSTYDILDGTGDSGGKPGPYRLTFRKTRDSNVILPTP